MYLITILFNQQTNQKYLFHDCDIRFDIKTFCTLFGF